jgi:hypothetical protein
VAQRSAVSRLLAGLRKQPHDFRPSLQVFPELNAEKIAADMELGAKGEERGKRAEPPSGSTTMDDIELAIIGRIDTEKNAAHTTLQDELTVYDQRLAALDFQGRFTAIRNAAPEAVAEFLAEVTEGKNELFTRKRHLIEVEAERDDFRQKHNIKRVSRHAKGGNLVLKIGVLMALLVIEIIANGIFLSKGSELGYLGGIVEAAVFAALNVLVSFGIGAVGVRWLNHTSIFKKLIGSVSLLAYLAFAVLLNLALAHYREISGTILEDAGREVVTKLFANPLGLTDLKSWLFFLMGLAFSAIAFGDAFFVYDPFPGFGPLQKRVDEAHEDYIAFRRDLTDSFRDIRDEAVEAMEEANRDLSLRRSEYDAILRSRTRLIQLFNAHQDHLEKAANLLLTAYRTANAQARPTESQAPARFQAAYQLSRMSVLADSADVSASQSLRKTIEVAQQLLERQVIEMHEEFKRAVKSLDDIENILPGASNGSSQSQAA